MKAFQLTGAHAGKDLACGAIQFHKGVSQHMNDAEAEVWAPILDRYDVTAEVIDIAPHPAAEAPAVASGAEDDEG